MDTTLYEASSSLTPLKESGAGESRKGIWRMKLIAGDIQGSSGYYPGTMLERDGPLVFPAGTHVFYDHPSSDEEWSRPERSVRDLAGTFATAAAYEADAPEGPGLYANVQLFPETDTWLEPRAGSVGMSIRANGTVAETDEGRTITSLTEGLSVDIVTRAGAGGKVLQLMESNKKPAAAGASDDATAATLKSLAEGQTKTNEVLASLVTALTESTKTKTEEAPKGLTAVELVTKLNESGLPDAARTRVAQVYKDGDDLDALVAAEQKYIDALTESTKKGGVKRGHTTEGETTTTGVVESGKSTENDKSTDAFAEAAALLDLGV